MKKPAVICFTNNKGGSGKSTTAGNLGAAIAKAGKKVLLIDGDMQLNLTLSFFEEERVIEMADSSLNLYQAVTGRQDLSGFTYPTRYENLDLIPSSMKMSSIERDLNELNLKRGQKRELVLRDCLSGIRKEGVYDYVLIDAPPTLGIWVMNILCASDYAVIPVEASPWGMFGLANMFDFINEASEINEELEVLGIAVTRADFRKGYFKQTMETLREMSGIHVFETLIRVDSSIEWAQDASAPVVEFKRSSRSAKEYTELSKEVMERAGR
ncbi:MAG: ParA family protein [Blautia sp.]|nr:ParA family protein [Blautia sp.]